MVSKKQIAEIENVIEQMTMQELMALRTGINERINSIEQEEKDKFAEEAREWAEKARQLGLNLPDVLGITPPMRRERLSSATNASGRASPKPKYTDPVSGKTYSGRGIMAGWLQTYVEDGLKQGIPKEKTLEKYLTKE